MAVPTAIALRHSLSGSRLEWTDDDVMVVTDFDDRDELTAISRVSHDSIVCGSSEGQGYRPRALAILKKVGPSYADAVGAALLRGDELPSLVAAKNPELKERELAPWRLPVALAALTTSLFAATIAPGVVAGRAARHSAVQLASLNQQLRLARWNERELAITSDALRIIEEFDAGRRSMTIVLGDLTESLPTTVSLVSVRLDREGGAVVAVSSRGAAVLADLRNARTITAPSIVGPVSTESSEGERRERVTVRFRWRTQVPEPRRQSSARALAR
jgi:hypothetical protein